MSYGTYILRSYYFFVITCDPITTESAL